ncbi:MAG: hypothetical protein QW405_01025 [Fervidicoccaceae archaeon]
MTSRARGVSGVIATVIIALMISLFVAASALLYWGSLRVHQEQEYRFARVAEARVLEMAIEGEWRYDVSGRLVEAVLRSSYKEPVEVLGLILVYPNGSAIVASSPSSPLPPGGELRLSASSPVKPSLVFVGVAAGELASAVVRLKEAPLAPPPPSISPWALELLPRQYSSPLVTWGGEVELPTEEVRSGNVISVRADGSYGDAGAVQRRDGAALVASSKIAGFGLRIIDSSLVIYDDFPSNPLPASRLVRLSGSWSWTPPQRTVQETSSARAPPTDEHVALVNTTAYGAPAPANLTGKIFFVIKLRADNNEDYHGLVVLNTTDLSPGGRPGLVELSISPMSDKIAARIYEPARGWRELNSTAYNFAVGEFYVLVAEIDLGARSYRGLALSSSGALLAEVSASAPSVEPSYVGLANYRPAMTTFDYVGLSLGRSPLYVYVLGTSSSLSVILSTPNATFSGTYDEGLRGHVVPIFPNPAGLSLELVNATLSVYNGTTLLTKYTGLVRGGDVFGLFFELSDAVVEAEVSLDVSGALARKSLLVDALAQANESDVSLVLEVYNWASGAYEIVASSRGALDVLSELWKVESYVDASGLVKLRLSASSSSPFVLSVDSLTSSLKVLVPGPPTSVLAIAAGDEVDIYRVDAAGASVSVSPLLSAALPPGASPPGARSDLALLGSFAYAAVYDASSGNVSVYKSLLSSPAEWSLLGVCPGGSVGYAYPPLLEASRSSRLLVLVHGDRYCVFNATSLLSSGYLPTGLAASGPPGYELYAASASSDDVAYFTVVDSATNSSLLMIFDFSSSSFSEGPPLPSGRPVGLAWGAELLWLAARGGAVEPLNPSTGLPESQPLPLPFAPLEPGDRLEYIDGLLVFVRGEDGRELWWARAG